MSLTHRQSAETLAAKVLAVMEPYRAYVADRLREASGLGAAEFDAAVSCLLRSRRVEAEYESRTTVYFLPC
jgi:hypothetical protein